MHKIKNIFGLKKIFLSFLIFFTFFSPVIESEVVGIGGDGIVWATEGEECYKDGKKGIKNENGTCIIQNYSDSDNNKMKQAGVELIMMAISAIVVFTMWIINWAGYLLHPATVFDPAIIPTLKSFRILFKNTILTLSVFILIGIALKNLFKLGSIGDLGKDIGKFIVILVLINFSWFAVKFVIDIGAIAGRSSFTLSESFGKRAFWDNGYRMYGPTIVQWTGDGNFGKKAYESIPKNAKYDICIKYYDSKEDAKSAHKKFKENGNKSGEKCDLGPGDKKNKSEAYAMLSKNIITLYPISDGGELGYDLPTAILWSFIPIGEFYKIGAGTKNFGTLFTESIFSLGTAIIMIISVLAMLIIFLQRLVYLWVFLIISPLFFFEKLLGLLNESWGNFMNHESIKPANLIAQAIFIPVGFGVLYTGIAVLGGELFYNNLLEEGINAYNGIDYKNTGTGNLGSAFKLIIGVGVMIGLWKGTQAVAKMSGGLAETVVNKSMDAISGISLDYIKDKAMYSKLFTTGGGDFEGQKVNLLHTVLQFKDKNSEAYKKGVKSGEYEYKERLKAQNKLYGYNKLEASSKAQENTNSNQKNKENNIIVKIQNNRYFTQEEFTEGFKRLGQDFTNALNEFKKGPTKDNTKKLASILKEKGGYSKPSLIIRSFAEKHIKEGDFKDMSIQEQIKIQKWAGDIDNNIKTGFDNTHESLKKVNYGYNDEISSRGSLTALIGATGISDENKIKFFEQLKSDGISENKLKRLGFRKELTTLTSNNFENVKEFLKKNNNKK